MLDAGTGAAAEFGRLLHHHRRASGLTQEELAQRAGVSVRAISDMERGRSRGPQQRSVGVLGDALGLTGDELQTLLQAAQQGRIRKPMGPIGLCELPPDLPDLIGRSAEREWMSGLLDAMDRSQTNAATVGVITGQPGVGKTVLAVGAGYEWADRFPGGVYFLDLRGADTQPLSSAAALDRLLRSMGVAESAIPRELDERASLFRSVTARQPMLLVLDNAHDEAQVRPLLARSASCLQLITSRRALSGLEAVRRLDLDVLPADDAVRLLASAAGADFADEDAAQVARLCGYLPLAVRIAGNRLSARRQLTLTGLVELLADQHRRLSVLAIGDRQVRAAFEVSYQQLSEPAQRVFRMLALAPQPDVGIGLSAAVSGLDQFDVLEALDELCEASLLMPSHRDRYRFHDLLWLFARECLGKQESAQSSRSALDAMCRWLVAQVADAGERLDPERGDDTDAIGWLDAEAGNWRYALEHEAACGRHASVASAIGALHWFSDMRARQHPWVELFSLGLVSAREAGERALAAVMLSFLCWAQMWVERNLPVAWRTHEEALSELRAVGDRRNEAWTLAYASSIKRHQGEFAASEPLALASLELFTDIGYVTGVEIVRGILGICALKLGRPEEALRLHREQLESFQAASANRAWQLSNSMQSHTFWRIAEDLGAMGRWAEALSAYQEMARLSDEIDMSHMVGIGLRGQGLAHIRMGDPRTAIAVLESALELLRDIPGDPRDGVETFILLGEAERDAGDLAASAGWCRQGLAHCAQAAGHAQLEDLVAALRDLLALTVPEDRA